MANANYIEEYAVSLPFTITQQGIVGDTTSQEKIWSDRVMSVIGTAVSERILRYNFGSRLYQEIYNGTTAAKEAIRREISVAFSNHLPLLNLVGVLFKQPVTESELNIEIRYALPNDAEATVYIGTVTLQGAFPPSEVF